MTERRPRCLGSQTRSWSRHRGSDGRSACRRSRARIWARIRGGLVAARSSRSKPGLVRPRRIADVPGRCAAAIADVHVRSGALKRAVNGPEPAEAAILYCVDDGRGFFSGRSSFWHTYREGGLEGSRGRKPQVGGATGGKRGGRRAQPTMRLMGPLFPHLPLDAARNCKT